MSKEALFYSKLENGAVKCGICPHNCRITTGKSGLCRVRTNEDGILIAENYGALTAIHSDPIEKKPIYHYFPGRQVLSAGSFGCNFYCTFCQNHEISQNKHIDLRSGSYSPEDLLKKALKSPDNIGLAYTYNEPTVFFEFMLDTARLIHDEGLKNIMVSNGFINEQPLDALIDIIDCFNIDLKFWLEDDYQRISSGQLKPVLNTIDKIARAGKHLELTHLVISGINDKPEIFREMVDYISGELGCNTVLHLSRYFPRYHMTNEVTTEETLLEFRAIAREKLNYVYIGNVDLPGCSDTHCPKCGSLCIQRLSYDIMTDGLNENGECKTCGEAIAIC